MRTDFLELTLASSWRNAPDSRIIWRDRGFGDRGCYPMGQPKSHDQSGSVHMRAACGRLAGIAPHGNERRWSGRRLVLAPVLFFVWEPSAIRPLVRSGNNCQRVDIFDEAA